MPFSELHSLSPNVPSHLRCLTVPEELRRHPLVTNRFFYTLPSGLLRELETSIRLKKRGTPDWDPHPYFQTANWKMEYRLSELAEGYANSIGFYNGEHLTFEYRRRKTVNTNTPQSQGTIAALHAGWLAVFSEELDKLHQHYRAYLGWLLTNRQFLDEHHVLWEHLGNSFQEYGVPRTLFLLPEASYERQALPLRKRKALIESHRQLSEFCERWRLQKIEAPFLPLPLPFQNSIPDTPLTQMTTTQPGMTSVAHPDILPIPTGPRLQSWHQNAASSASTESDAHLKDWLEIISPRRSKRELPRYERLFDLQHYYRSLAQRHPALLPRNKSKIEIAFASYFGTEEDLIKREFSALNRRLGANWFAADL